jgi:short-subunit dehydrogenase
MSNKTAIIVGASSGIGADLSRQLAEKGYKLGLIARRKEMLEGLNQEIGGDAEILTLDVSSKDAAEKFSAFLDKLSATVVILNAGIGTEEKELSNAAELKVVDINVRGFTDLAVASYNYFKKKGAGHIAGVSSILALTPCPQAPAYAASKAYVSSYMASLRGKAKNEKFNLTVTDIKPGFVATPMTESVDGMFWLAPSTQAAEQIIQAIEGKKDHAYITRRWRLIGWLLKLTPINLLNVCINKF